MPSTMDFEFDPGKTFKVWNIAVKVGAGGATSGMDVKLCQYLLATVFDEKGVFSFSDVIGTWGPKSRAALRRMELKNEVSADGCIDPMKRGRAIGSISHKVYKLFLLQQGYLARHSGGTIGELRRKGISPEEIERTLMSMPEDNENMPADLRFALIGARGGQLEL